MKKIVVFVLAILMVFAVFGCSATPASQQAAEEAPAAEASQAPAAEEEAPAAEAADDEIVIGLTLMDYNFPFFQDMLAMAKLTADQLGVKIVDLDGAGDVQKQLQGVEDMISGTKIDALFLNPVDSSAISPAVMEANAAGIPVITVDVRAAEGETTAHVSSNNLDIGREAAKYAIDLLKKKNGSEKGKVLVMGFPQITSMADRAKGFLEVVSAYPEIEVIQKDPINLNVQEAQSLMEDLLQTYQEGALDIVYGSNATNAVGIVSATEAAGRKDFDIIGVDDDPELLNALQRDGAFAATVVQSPTEMGRLGVEFAVKAAKGETIEEKDVATALRVVTRDDIATFLEDYNALQAKLAAFK